MMCFVGALFVDMCAHMFRYMIDRTENTHDQHVGANKDETVARSGVSCRQQEWDCPNARECNLMQCKVNAIQHLNVTQSSTALVL